MLAEKIEHFNIKNIFINQPIKNNLINQGYFYKLLYSNDIFTLNGIHILLKFNNTKYLNNRLYYDILDSDNDIIINKLFIIEKYILNIIENNNNKKIYYKLYEQLKSGNIKVNNNSSAFILKLSGIWENDYSIGITFKIININKIINLHS